MDIEAQFLDAQSLENACRHAVDEASHAAEVARRDAQSFKEKWEYCAHKLHQNDVQVKTSHRIQGWHEPASRMMYSTQFNLERPTSTKAPEAHLAGCRMTCQAKTVWPAFSHT